MKRTSPLPVLCVGLTPALQEVRVFASIEMGGVNRCLSVGQSAAGKGTNAAHVLKTLGHEAVLTGFVGGATGSLFRRDLTALGIRSAFVKTAAPTRVCVTLIERDSKRATELVEESALPSLREWQTFYRTFNRLISRAGLLTLTGALMPGAPPTVYRDLAGLAARRQIPTIIDSQKAPLLDALVHRPLLVKLNVRELESTLASTIVSPSEIVAGARELLARGAVHALVTHGEHGAWLVAPAAAWHYASPRVTVCNPIGSGDAVTGGIAFGLHRQHTLLEAVRLGIACGAANVLTPLPGLVRQQDVKRLLPKTTFCVVQGKGHGAN